MLKIFILARFENVAHGRLNIQLKPELVPESLLRSVSSRRLSQLPLKVSFRGKIMDDLDVVADVRTELNAARI